MIGLQFGFQLGGSVLVENGKIAAVFDNDPTKVGMEIAGHRVLPMEKCRSIVDTFGIHVAILSVPADVVQEITDWLVSRGITAIWNFAPLQLKVPREVIVRNENLAVGLARRGRETRDVADDEAF